MRVSVCVCLRSFCPSDTLRVCSAAAGLSVVSPCVCPSVGVCHWNPSGPRGLRVSAPREGEGGQVAARGGGEGRGRRQWAGAGAGGGGRGRRAARRGCVRGAGGGGCQSRLSLRRGTSAASSSRRGPARPGSAASGESPASAGTLPRPAAHSASGENVRSRRDPGPQTGRPPRPRACPATPPAAPHSSLTLASPPNTYGRPRGSLHPAGPAAASALEFLWGPPSVPSPARPSLRPLADAPCLGRNPSCAGSWRRAGCPPSRSRNRSAPAQRPAEAPFQAQASPSHGDSVSILGKGEAQRKPRVIISLTRVS